MSSLTQDLPSLPPLGDKWSPSRFRINAKSPDEHGDMIDKQVADSDSQDPFWPPESDAAVDQDGSQGLAYTNYLSPVGDMYNFVLFLGSG